MAVSKSEMAFALAIMAMSLLAVASAQNAPQDFVDAYNTARAADGVGPVSWDTEVANYSQSYAVLRASIDCKLKFSNGSYGENQFWGSAGTAWTAADAVGLWVEGKQFYHYGNNTCDIGESCGSYKQVVWRNSTRIGCARVICNYDPAAPDFGEGRPFTARP